MKNQEKIHDRIVGMLTHSGAQTEDVDRFTHMMHDEQSFTRRLFLQTLGIGATGVLWPAHATTSNQAMTALPEFTGPDPNPLMKKTKLLNTSKLISLQRL